MLGAIFNRRKPMYHPRLKGSPYNMGYKFGTILKTNNVKIPIKLDTFQTKFGKASGKLLNKYFPEAAEEIRGVTDAIECNNKIFTSWLMCMGCCMYNLEEQNFEVRGCTAFSFIHNNQIFHGRDNDLPPFLKKVSKSIYYKPDNKLNFILNTSSFINGEEGINEAGLVAAMTFVLPKIEEIKPGINSLFLVRYILENCKTVSEGIKVLKNFPIASSCNIILTDQNMNMVVVECNPLKIRIRKPENNINGEYFIVAVNHFTLKEMWKHDASNRNIFYSKERYQTAFNALKNIKYTNGIEHAKNILSGKHGFMCQYEKKLNFETIWSSIFDITNGKVYRAEGNPQRVKYKKDKRYLKSKKNST
jgi:predicted choloylglycine hydrolase